MSFRRFGKVKGLWSSQWRSGAFLPVLLASVLVLSFPEAQEQQWRQNDAGSGGDAGNTLETATLIISRVQYNGYLNSYEHDSVDCYKFEVSEGQFIEFTPISHLFYRHDRNGHYEYAILAPDGSLMTPAHPFSRTYIAPSSGYCYLRVTVDEGVLDYDFTITVSEPVRETKTEGKPTLMLLAIVTILIVGVAFGIFLFLRRRAAEKEYSVEDTVW